MKYSMMIFAAAMAASAAAGPITTPPPVISAMGGDVKAVYIFSDANDASYLGLTTPPPNSMIFCNHVAGPCSMAASSGNIVDLGNRSGVLNFTLTNITMGSMYDSLHPDAFGDYHAKIGTSISAFGLNASQLAAAAPGVAVAATLPNVTYFAWEDRNASQGSDFDYNDLIFAFSRTAPVHNPGVPEPLTLSLLGAGLLGVFGLRRNRKA